MYGALIASNKFNSNSEIVRLTNKLYGLISWTDAVKDNTGDATFPQKMFLKFNTSGIGDDSALTNPYNEYVIVSYLAYQRDIIDAVSGKSTSLWNGKFSNPNNSPQQLYRNPVDNGATTYNTLTDNSGYIPNFTNIFAHYMVNYVSLDGDYGFFIDQAAQADKAWFQSLNVNLAAITPGDNYNKTFTNNINIDNNKYNNQVTAVVESYEWGLGEGEEPPGIHHRDFLGAIEQTGTFSANEVNENPAFIVSPAIIAGFMYRIAGAKSDFGELFRNKPIAKYVFTGASATNPPLAGNTNAIELIWRYSLYPGHSFTEGPTTYNNSSQLGWKSDKIQGIDLAPQLLGLAADQLGFGFFSTNNEFTLNSTIIDSEVALSEILEDSNSDDGADNANGIAVSFTQLSQIIGLNDERITNISGYQDAINAETNFSNPPTLEEIQAIIDAVNSEDEDNDGLPDDLDPDDNNVDTDGDGIPDGNDVDVDGDGTNDNGTDTDGDGINDVSDVDVDGDGTNDNGIDSDGDGINDANDIVDINLPVEPVVPVPDIEVVQAFTPNGDGVNDTLVITGIENYPNSNIVIYNRYGHKVFSAKAYQNDWRGTYKDNSDRLPASSYYYVINLGVDSSPKISGWLFINY